MRRLFAGAVCLLAALSASVPAALAHQGNPDFRSVIDGYSPATAGIGLGVLNLDDRLSLTNRSAEAVVVDGYNGEPYVRILPDGTVQVNRLSPATYLNSDRTGAAKVPGFADFKAAPQWQLVDRTGHYEWHDHRIHYMAKGTPPQVKDTKLRTKVFDWKVPVKVGDRSGAIRGTLFWQPRDDHGLPVWLMALLGVLVVGGGAAMVRVRGRRDAAADAGGGPGEAW